MLAYRELLSTPQSMMFWRSNWWQVIIITWLLIGLQIGDLITYFKPADRLYLLGNDSEIIKKYLSCKTVDELYKECDYITIHVPALESTKGMINKDAISLMKKDVVVLNFARDVLVNEEDMIDALESGKVKRYVTDFPNPLVAGVKGTIVIPHLGVIYRGNRRIIVQRWQ